MPLPQGFMHELKMRLICTHFFVNEPIQKESLSTCHLCGTIKQQLVTCDQVPCVQEHSRIQSLPYFFLSVRLFLFLHAGLRSFCKTISVRMPLRDEDVKRQEAKCDSRTASNNFLSIHKWFGKCRHQVPQVK